AHPRGYGRRLALRRLALAALALAAAAGAGAGADEYVWPLPRGFPVPAVPADTPMSDAKVRLGAALFFDPRLSVTGRYSCASCHEPARAFSDGRRVARGATGAALPHNALALVNVAYSISLGWSHREPRTLEAQMLEPMLNEHPVELGLRGRERPLIAALAADPESASAFAAAFPGEAAPVSFRHTVQAIAAFERTLLSGASPFDRYVFSGEHAALSAEAKAGMALFFSARAGCAACHSGINFAGNYRDAQGATGRASFARDGTSERALRVPTLRNLAFSAPYMHDGRFATLAEVLAHYSALARHPERLPDRRLPHAPFAEAETRSLPASLDSLNDPSCAARCGGAAAAREAR